MRDVRSYASYACFRHTLKKSMAKKSLEIFAPDSALKLTKQGLVNLVKPCGRRYKALALFKWLKSGQNSKEIEVFCSPSNTPTRGKKWLILVSFSS